MEGFILEVNSSDVSKLSYVIWGIDISFENLTPEIGG